MENNYKVTIEPAGCKDNEYATPCYLYFDDLAEATVFIGRILNHGKVVVTIEEDSE